MTKASAPNQYERELADTLAPLLVRLSTEPDERSRLASLRELVADQLARHRVRVATLYYAITPTGDESEEIMRASIKFARDMIGASCESIASDPRGQMVARYQRERFEIEAAYKRATAELEALKRGGAP